MTLRILLLLCFYTFLSCSKQKQDNSNINTFTSLYMGSFSSEAQANEEKGYANLTLVNIPIWEDKEGYWFYSENYLTESPNRIILQRIINVVPIDSARIKTARYALSEPERFKNGWKNPALFNDLALKNTIYKTGCDIYYNKKGNSLYYGKNKSYSCGSEFEGIDYLMTNVVLTSETLSVWVKGYDKIGKQVWGKIKGPYKYKRTTKE
ncbi:chromophore lyase CpcT/CpeT [Aquimarina brevivitae]|uniref:CpeT/CpcT family protein DUF1001 n=1 Tax=Aquimarina brevivitae TaxID=323412 RepID=A0A4Q7PHD4_9FLAO|nr:chromophore lyase CpcT/CpeT [Aquimarina brevivitae]RZS99983.1 CpeT/CpcT family protein DUF1001 [Aquimarina brevivitae]